MSIGQFVEDVYELAFGDGAIAKGYSDEEVLAKLREYSDCAYLFEVRRDIVDQCGGSIWNEHLDYTRQAWVTAVMSEHTNEGYWDWVLSQLYYDEVEKGDTSK